MTATPPSRSPRPLVALAAGLVLAVAGPVTADAAPTTVGLGGPDDAGVRFTGGLDQFAGGVPVPRRWTTVDGSVRLTWRASEQLTRGSGLQVRVGDRVVGSTLVGPGRGSASFAIPRSALRGASTVPVAIDVRLRTTDAQCPAPDDPSAWLQLDPSSAVTVDGRAPASTPRLRDLPDALVTAVGRRRGRVLVRFATPVTPAAVRAAGVAVGEIAAAAGGEGVAVRVATPGSATRRRTGESVVAIAEGGGGPRISSRAIGTDRAGVVVLEGRGDDLVRAAAALRPSVARRLPGTSASGTALPAPVVRRSSLPRRLRLPTGEVTGIAGGEVQLGFRIPEWREALRGSRLRLAASYDAPAGGRAVVTINGRDLVGEPLRSRGTSRFAVEETLAPRGPALLRADLRAGDNTVGIRTRLNRPRDLVCTPQSFGAGGLRAEDSGSITLQTRARPVTSTLSVLPFPLNRRPGWEGTTVQLPASPTEAELAAVVGTLAEARRASRELVLPQVRLGGDVPSGTALVLARPGAVPDDLAEGIPGPRIAGVLSASSSGDDVRILAIGAKALAPLANAYSIGKVQGRTVEAVSRDQVAIRVPDAQLVTGIERGPGPWRWPLFIIGAAIIAFATLALVLTTRRLRRRTAGAAHPVEGPDGDPRP